MIHQMQILMMVEKRYDIPFDQDPFTPQTISIATTSTIGTGISAFIDNSGDPSNAQSWDKHDEGFSC